MESSSCSLVTVERGEEGEEVDEAEGEEEETRDHRGKVVDSPCEQYQLRQTPGERKGSQRLPGSLRATGSNRWLSAVAHLRRWGSGPIP